VPGNESSDFPDKRGSLAPARCQRSGAPHAHLAPALRFPHPQVALGKREGHVHDRRCSDRHRNRHRLSSGIGEGHHLGKHKNRRKDDEPPRGKIRESRGTTPRSASTAPSWDGAQSAPRPETAGLFPWSPSPPCPKAWRPRPCWFGIVFLFPFREAFKHMQCQG
jgi:hypothetical protein